MSDRFPDFMRMDLSNDDLERLFFGVPFIVGGLGATIAIGAVLNLIFPGFIESARQERWLLLVAFVPGFAAGAGFFRLGSWALTRLGLGVQRTGEAATVEPISPRRDHREGT
jgi:hypothetical protein